LADTGPLPLWKPERDRKRSFSAFRSANLRRWRSNDEKAIAPSVPSKSESDPYRKGRPNRRRDEHTLTGSPLNPQNAVTE
jgi:hypothetical protein